MIFPNSGLQGHRGPRSYLGRKFSPPSVVSVRPAEPFLSAREATARHGSHKAHSGWRFTLPSPIAAAAADSAASVGVRRRSALPRVVRRRRRRRPRLPSWAKNRGLARRSRCRETRSGACKALFKGVTNGKSSSSFRTIFYGYQRKSLAGPGRARSSIRML